MIGTSETGRTRPRVAFFLRDLDGGGAERSILALAADISHRGVEVDLVVGDAHGDYRDEVSDALCLFDFRTRNPLWELRGLVGYLRRRRPDVIMSALDLANILLVTAAGMAFYKGRIVVSQRATVEASLRELTPLRRAVTRGLLRFCFPRAAAVISNSHRAAREVTDFFGVPAGKVTTIHNAVHIDRIAASMAAAEGGLDIPDVRRPLIISVGSLTKRKDMGTLIRAYSIVRRTRDVELAILGKGPEQAEVETLISELGLRDSVRLVGFDANPYRWMARAAMLVSSSTEEGFPNVIAEALAAGIPVVATDCPGDGAELLAHGKWGRLVPVGQPERMADAILATLDDVNPPDGRLRAHDFAPEKITSTYLNILLPGFGEFEPTTSSAV